MRRNLFAPLPLLIMLVLLTAGLPARAACTARNPNANVIESAPTSDFTINGDGTVTHSKTGLMWKQCAEGLIGAGCSIGTATPMTWANALKAANAANTAAFAGYTDWRLPNKKELESIVELCGSWPSINQTVFPGTPASDFWSGSSYVARPALAWSLDFAFGVDEIRDLKSSDKDVRLVRGGQSVDSFDLLNSTSQSDCVFDWVERMYSNLFAPAGAVSKRVAPYYYRYYSQTDAYLGTSSVDNHVYYRGPATNYSIVDEGAMFTWLPTAGCQ